MWPTGRSRPWCCAPTTLGFCPSTSSATRCGRIPRSSLASRCGPTPRSVDPRQFLREHMRVEPAPPGACALTLERLEDVAPARGQVAALALASGVASARIDDVKVSVGEITINALLHGCAPAGLWSYVRDDAFVIHVHDRGRGPRTRSSATWCRPWRPAEAVACGWRINSATASKPPLMTPERTSIAVRARALQSSVGYPRVTPARALSRLPGSHRIEACRVGPKPQPPPDSLRGEAERAREPLNGRRRRRARRRAL